jgi:hypothetical protein
MENPRLQTYFDNWKLLRANMYIESEIFRELNKDKYSNKIELGRALRRHLENKFRADTDKLMFLHQEILSQDF